MSSETPKKIWFDKDYLTVGFEPIDDRDIPYIRADLMDELVETLKKLRVWTSPAIHNEYGKPMIEAALKKLEESHD